MSTVLYQREAHVRKSSARLPIVTHRHTHCSNDHLQMNLEEGSAGWPPPHVPQDNHRGRGMLTRPALFEVETSKCEAEAELLTATSSTSLFQRHHYASHDIMTFLTSSLFIAFKKCSSSSSTFSIILALFGRSPLWLRTLSAGAEQNCRPSRTEHAPTVALAWHTGIKTRTWGQTVYEAEVMTSKRLRQHFLASSRGRGCNEDLTSLLRTAVAGFHPRDAVLARY